MQIDTHIIDIIETENDVKNGVTNLDLSLTKGALQKILQFCPKKRKIERWMVKAEQCQKKIVLSFLSFSVFVSPVLPRNTNLILSYHRIGRR